MLQQKYSDLLQFGQELQIKDGHVREENNQLHIGGTAHYQYDKDRIWNKIKTYSGWENEIVADIKVENEEIYGIYTVQSGDSLSKISKQLFGDPMRYKEIFDLNTDILSNPDRINVGQQLKLPRK